MTDTTDEPGRRIDAHEQERRDESGLLDDTGWPVASRRPPAAVEQDTTGGRKGTHRSANEPDVDERRRAVVGGLAAAVCLPGNGFAGVSNVRLSALSAAGDDRDISAEPHTVATFEALADAAVPRTPALADERGAEHGPGGLDVDLDQYLVWSLNHLLPFPTPVDLADQVAQLLDRGADLLVTLGANEDPPTVTQFPDAGLFGRLSRKDRFRAIHLLEEEGVTLMTLVNILVHFGYYSEWSGYENNTDPPTDRTFTGAVQSWEQTAFPGPAVGYRDFRGYLVEEFEEGEFGDDDEQGDENGDSQGSGDEDDEQGDENDDSQGSGDEDDDDDAEDRDAEVRYS